MGVVPAPYFFGIDHQTGQINVKTDLRNDKGFEYIVTVQVYDDANPDQKAYANLTVEVRRNENKPVFNPEEYNANILEIVPVGTTVAQVSLSQLTLKVLVATIDAQWEGMGDVGLARYEPALHPPCPTITGLSCSN